MSDTLIGNFSPEEIEAILAHELGHHKYRHTAKLIFLSFLNALLALYLGSIFLNRLVSFFGYGGVRDIAGLPVLLCVFFLVGLVILPLQNGFSRFLERQADSYSLIQTKDSSSFVSMMEKLGKLNLADPCPKNWVKFFFYDHPPIGERIERAKRFSY